MNLDLVKLRQYLTDNGISDSSVGGAVNQDVSKARFFVIHDTSSPEISAAEFPSNMNEAAWGGNKLSNWVQSATPTHVFVNRMGESAMKANFKDVVGATKYEAGRDLTDPAARSQARNRRRGLFVHIELIQPRRRSNPNSAYFDIPPSPGFTPKQLDRLALLYVVVSVRAKRWLLPAFHLSVDATIAEAHDDPQNFDLETWLNSLSMLLVKLRQ
jgi:predicted Fe-Mo cluster-binding NifX family protein